MRAHERAFRVMGSDAQVLVVGDPALADDAEARLRHLESVWSRFLPDSEISRYNAALHDPAEAAAARQALSPETRRLLDAAEEGARISDGRFDPYRLAAVTRAGYTASRDADPGAVPVAPLSGFDPGGIGKGLAADIVTAEVIAAGADGVLVGVGGDLRVRGSPRTVAPGGSTWRTRAVVRPSPWWSCATAPSRPARR